MVRIRIFQALFFIPCCFVDAIGLFFVNIPVWIFTGVGPVTKESYIEWILDLPKYIKQ